jgi:hypothetical protein
MRFVLFSCFLFLWLPVEAQIDSIRLTCLPHKIESVHAQDLLWMYRQRDTLPNHSASGDLNLVIDGQIAKLNDSTSLRYLASLRVDYPALDSIWAPVLRSEVAAFEIQKDSLKQRIGHLGWSMRFLQAVRNLKRQQELKNSGRSQVFLSFHNFNLAADVGLYARRRYLRRSPRYTRMGQEAKQLGMFWGGDFVGFPDPGHVQRFINSADFVSKFPELAFEFERYRDHYQSIILKNANRLNKVRDTEALLKTLDRLKLGKVCACQIAIMPQQAIVQNDDALAEVSTQQNWVYLKPRDGNGYFYSLGRWAFMPKN